MSRVKNIATLLILTAIMLLAGNRYAHAQNSPEFPYIDSWHKYSVIMGTGNSHEWKMYSSEADAFAGASELTGFSTSIGGVAPTATINIFFDDIYFDPGTYYLVYYEYTADNCTARRIYPITIRSNSMRIVAGTGVVGCNIYSGNTWDNSVGDLSDADYPVEVSFTISLIDDSGEDFRISGWNVTGAISIDAGAYTFNNTFNLTGTSTHNGTYTISGSEAAFNLNVINVDDIDIDSDEVTFTIALNGNITEDLVITLELNSNTDCYASYGSLNPGVYTNGTGNFTTTHTVYGVPNTSVISVLP